MTPPVETRLSRLALTMTASWRHRGRTDVHGHRLLTVVAHRLSGNEDPAPTPGRADGHQRANEVTVSLESGQDRSRETIRLSREGAEALLVALEAALAWDGVAP